MWGTTAATIVTSKFYFFSNLTDFKQHPEVLDDPSEELYSIVSLREIKSHNGWDFPWKFYQNARRDHKWRFAQKTKGTQLSSAAAQSRGFVRIFILGCGGTLPSFKNPIVYFQKKLLNPNINDYFWKLI